MSVMNVMVLASQKENVIVKVTLLTVMVTAVVSNSSMNVMSVMVQESNITLVNVIAKAIN